MSLNVSAMSWVMCDDDDDDDDNPKPYTDESKKCCVKKISDERIKLYRNPEKLIIEKR